MRFRISSAPILLLCLCCAGAQQNSPPAGNGAADATPAPLVIHYADADVTLPELLPFSQSITPQQHCKKLNGTVTVLVVVDGNGDPRDYYFIHPTGSDLDRMALVVAGADRFRPGTAQGAPAAVAVADEIKLQACLQERKDETGKKDYFLGLKSTPEQKLTEQEEPLASPNPAYSISGPLGHELLPDGTYRVGGPVSAPRPLNTVDASYSDKARREHINGNCLITTVVDKHGMPQNPRIVRSLEPSLDANALEAVMRYRFVPAMRNGEPVPVRITVQISFRLYPPN